MCRNKQQQRREGADDELKQQILRCSFPSKHTSLFSATAAVLVKRTGQVSEPKLDQPQKDTTGALSRFIADFMFKISLLAPADVEDGGLLQKDPTVRVRQVSKGQNFSH